MNQKTVITLYTKGADSVMEPRLAKCYSELASASAKRKEETWQNLKNYACRGLRTLLLAKRTVTEEYYADWSQRYQAASAALEEREQKMENVMNELEQDL